MDTVEAKRMSAKALLQYKMEKSMDEHRRLNSLFNVIPWESISKEEEQNIYYILDNMIR